MRTNESSDPAAKCLRTAARGCKARLGSPGHSQGSCELSRLLHQHSILAAAPSGYHGRSAGHRHRSNPARRYPELLLGLLDAEQLAIMSRVDQ